jgi:hypothetical protein
MKLGATLLSKKIYSWLVDLVLLPFLWVFFSFQVAASGSCFLSEYRYRVQAALFVS